MKFLENKTIEKCLPYDTIPAYTMDLDCKGKTHTTAKFHRTNLVICSHSKEGKTLSYSQINMVPKI